MLESCFSVFWQSFVQRCSRLLQDLHSAIFEILRLGIAHLQSRLERISFRLHWRQTTSGTQYRLVQRLRQASGRSLSGTFGAQQSTVSRRTLCHGLVLRDVLRRAFAIQRIDI